MNRRLYVVEMMRRLVYSAVAVALVVSFAVPAEAQNLDLDTVEFFSPAVDRTMKYNILLPHDYDTSTERYPVLYLLHGLTQNYTAWGLSNGAPFYAGLYDDLIVVMPDGATRGTSTMPRAPEARPTTGKTTSSRTSWVTWTRTIERSRAGKAV